MSRKELLRKAYYRDSSLKVALPRYQAVLRHFTELALKDDLGEAGDITSNVVLGSNKVKTARITAKASGIVAGIEEGLWFYERHKIACKAFKSDGENIKPSKVVLELGGPERDLLATERVGINLLQRMSGIATETNRLVRLAKPLVVAATRKTPWGALDNKAVAVGGGATHRLGLWDAILIKENHLAGIGIETALKRAWAHRNKAGFIEIEVESPSQALVAAEIFKQLPGNTPRIIMFDNFSVEGIRKTVGSLKQKGLYDQVLLEASGGITPENITQYRDSGVDVVSLGYLTHSVKALDISMRIL